MSEFRFSMQEETDKNVKRLLGEQMDYILFHCEGDQDDVHKSIHEIRKSIKRIRAVLRLVRDNIGYSSYYRENVFYRDLNRISSELRTSNVLLQSLENLEEDVNPGNGELNGLKQSIEEKREAYLAELNSDADLLQKLGSGIRTGKKRLEDMPVPAGEFETISGGIFRMYRQGRNYLKATRKESDTHLLHDFRKRVKYLWYHMELIRPVYPVQLKAYAESLEKIADRLGDYHDYANLKEYLANETAGKKDKLVQTLMDACDFKMSALLPEIHSHADVAFAEKPEALIRRLDEYWKLARRIS